MHSNFTTAISDYCNKILHPNAISVFNILYPNPFSKNNCKLLVTPYSQLFLYLPTHQLIMVSTTPTNASFPLLQLLLMASLSPAHMRDRKNAD
jgi:hypothetical protein